MKHALNKTLALLAATAALANHAAAITIDGDFSDWTNVPVIATDPLDNVLSIDFRTLHGGLRVGPDIEEHFPLLPLTQRDGFLNYLCAKLQDKMALARVYVLIGPQQ